MPDNSPPNRPAVASASASQLLHALWRKAFASAEPLRIPCRTPSQATRMRFSLYDSVRKVRAGTQKADAELLHAIEQCSIGFDPEDRSVLVIQRKVMTEMMQVVADLLADCPEAIQTNEETELKASQEALLELLGQKAPASSAPLPPPGESLTSPYDFPIPRQTPYYTR